MRIAQFDDIFYEQSTLLFYNSFVFHLFFIFFHFILFYFFFALFPQHFENYLIHADLLPPAIKENLSPASICWNIDADTAIRRLCNARSPHLRALGSSSSFSSAPLVVIRCHFRRIYHITCTTFLPLQSCAFLCHFSATSPPIADGMSAWSATATHRNALELCREIAHGA